MTMITQTVRVMDTRNRLRFQEDGQLLGSWLSASKVLGSPAGLRLERCGRLHEPVAAIRE